MKALVIGTDRSVFEPRSAARERVAAYGRLFDGYHVIVYTSPGFREEALGQATWLYPTNSRAFFLRPFDAARIGRRIVRERGIDFVSAQDPAESGLAGWLLKRRTGLPLHIQIHSDFLSPFFRRNSWKERLRYWLAGFILPRGDAFRAVSQRVADSLRSTFQVPSSKIPVLPIFVDRARIAAAAPESDLRDRYPEFDFVVLMVSRLVREKNIAFALEAFAELIREFPKTGFVIVGGGPEREKLKLEIGNWKLEHCVRLEGWQSDPVSYYKTADLYLLTSNFEGYGRSVVEAAAAGLPIVMTDVGVAGELIRDGETGRVVPVGDGGALVNALIWAHRNLPEMREMAKRAQAESLAMRPRTWEEYLLAYRAAYILAVPS